MEQEAVPSPEPIALRSHCVGIRHPTGAIHHKHVSVLSWRQRKAQGPHAVLVRPVEGMCLGVPAVEGSHHADPLSLGRFHVEHCGSYALGCRSDRTTYQQGNEEEDARKRFALRHWHQRSGANRGDISRNVRIGARRRESETKRKRLDLPGDGAFPHDGPRSGKSSRTFALFCVSRSTAVSCACGTVIFSRHIGSPAMASVSL